MNIEDRLRQIIREELAPVLAALHRVEQPSIRTPPAQTDPTEPPSRWLTTSQAAEYLGIAKGTLENWRAAKPQQGPDFRRVGRAIRYDRAVIEAFVA